MTDYVERRSLDEVRIPGSAAPAAPVAPAAPKPMITAGLGLRYLGRVMTNLGPIVTMYAGVVAYLFASGGAMVLLALVLFLGGFGWVVWQVQRIGATGANQARRVAGIAIVDQTTGQPIGFGRSLVREMVPGALSALTCGIFGLVDVVVALVNPERLSIHDRMARTRVIRLDSMPVAPAPQAQSVTSPSVTPPSVASPSVPAPPVPSAGAWSPPTGVIGAAPGVAPVAPAAPEPAPTPLRNSLESETRVRPAITVPPTHPAAPSHPVLVVDGGQRIDVTGTVIVGRNPAAGAPEDGATLVAVPDPSMSLSKTHAAFGVVDDGSLWVEDRASTNGVALVVDGREQPVTSGEQTLVPPGASLRLGDREITVEMPGTTGGVVPIDGMPSDF